MDNSIPLFEILSPEEIVDKTVSIEQHEANRGEEDSETESMVGIKEALQGIESAIEFCDTQKEISFNDRMILRRIRTILKEKEMQSQKQSLITSFFNL